MLNLNHKKLDTWKEGIKFVTFIYKITEKFPKSELYGLTNQMRRAAVSIPSNISEGHPETQQLSEEDFTKFLVLLWLSSIRKSKLQLD